MRRCGLAVMKILSQTRSGDEIESAVTLCRVRNSVGSSQQFGSVANALWHEAVLYLRTTYFPPICKEDKYWKLFERALNEPFFLIK